VQPARLPIAIVITSFDPGGTERQMTELITRIDPQRFEVHVACFRRQGLWLAKVEHAVAEIAEFPLRSFQSPSTLRQLILFARWCRSRRVAVVHTCDFYANVFGLTGAALARVPVRIGSRRDLVLPGRSAAKHRLQRLAYRFAHRVVANSRAAARQLEREQVAPARIVVIPNGIDIDLYRTAPTRTPRTVVTTVANLRPEKGHDVLLDAAIRVGRERPGTVFQLVGDGPIREALDRRLSEFDPSSAVRLLGHREDVPDVLRASDLFVLPSRSEAFPNGVVEAMAAGLPVVASNVGGIPELIEDGRNGILVPVGDADALATAIIGLLDDSARARAIATRARETIEQGYSFDRMVASFEALYADTLGTRMSNSVPIPSHAGG
jgi:glycosyltransferase involved in cell wall biosynthesis